MLKPNPIKIRTIDNFELSGSLFKSKTISKGIITINAGTCIKRQFYFRLAAYLSKKNYDVLTFDYRGVGESRPASLKGFQASIRTWASLDIKSVIDWMNKNYPNQKKYIVAHSMGGQIIGLADNVNLLDKIVAINASYGNWKNYYGKHKITTAIFWATLFPISNWWNGYFPASKFGMGEDWASGVVKDWWIWSKYYLPHYQLMDKFDYPQYYHNVKIPILSYIMTDDNIATVKTIPFFEADYKNADLTVKIVEPKDYHLQSIGHFGYFKEKSQPIWDETIKWLENQ